MPPPLVVGGQDDQFLIRIKLFDQFADQRRAHQRVIDRAEDDSVGFDVLQAANPRPDGGQLALLPISIQDDLRGIELRDSADFIRACAKHDASYADARMARNLN